MPTAPDRRRTRRRRPAARVPGSIALLAATATATLALAGCGRVDPPMMPTKPTATATGTGSPSPDLTASPSLTPGGTASPSGTAIPGGSDSPSGTAAPVSCTSVTPIRIERSAVEPRRTTEVVTLVSDGRNLTPGTREQSAFESPTLTAPDGTTTITDEATLGKVADLIEGSSKNTVLLTRPESPDTGADANKPPFNATGTYVLYNASGLLSADVIVQCSGDGTAGAGQEQRWRFIAEADNTVGTINCAVEPTKGNAVARQVYGSFC
jgi:hypothetical protein